MGSAAISIEMATTLYFRGARQKGRGKESNGGLRGYPASIHPHLASQTKCSRFTLHPGNCEDPLQGMLWASNVPPSQRKQSLETGCLAMWIAVSCATLREFSRARSPYHIKDRQGEELDASLLLSSLEACIYSHNVWLRSHVLLGGAEGFTTASQEPAGHHPDRRYALDGKEVDEKGCSKSVVSHDIGSSFGQRRTPAGEDIIITFKSRDPGLEQVVEVLRYRISPLQGRV
ncbi:hypothetical protein K438DRAFT_2083854 [Mycena galopus ATCC 62051]|nr:hypothetical protein K438DRAFT_2083854 [Mycena galopus ATCC 62051]